VLTYLGIEVLTRVDWSRTWQHWMARAILLGPMASVSAFMSYLHLHHLMILSGEPGLAQAVGPLAIDGSLFGATVALLVTRHRARGIEDDAAPKVSLAQRVAAARTNIQAVAAAAKGEAQELAASVTDPKGVRGIDWDAELAKDRAALDIPANMVPVVQIANTVEALMAELPTVEDIRPMSPRPPRQNVTRNGWDVAKAVRLILDTDHSDAEIGDLVGISQKMIQRSRRAVRVLKSDPTATIPEAWKVPAQVLDVARREIRALS
jgi:hypothetical protein